eukprot:gene11162-biopygen2642
MSRQWYQGSGAVTGYPITKGFAGVAQSGGMGAYVHDDGRRGFRVLRENGAVESSQLTRAEVQKRVLERLEPWSLSGLSGLSGQK